MYPRESDASDPVAKHVAQNRRKRISSGEVSVEPWMLPMRHSGHYFALHVLHDFVPVLRLVGCVLGQQVAQVAGLHARRHSALRQRFQILANILDHLRSTATKLLAIHVHFSFGFLSFFKLEWVFLCLLISSESVDVLFKCAAKIKKEEKT